MQHYLANDQKLRRFVPIIQDSLVYPVVLDSARTVLSLPPIINSAHSAVRTLCPSLKCLYCEHGSEQCIGCFTVLPLPPIVNSAHSVVCLVRLLQRGVTPGAGT